MTRVDSLHVTGLAGRSVDIDINFDPKLNVIFGLNGLGKTSLLKIIHAALSNDHRAVTRIPVERASVTFSTNAGEKQYTRSIIRQTEEDADEGFYAVETEDGEIIEFSSRAAAESPTQWLTKPRSLARFPHSFLNTSRLMPTRNERGPVPRRQSQRYEEAIDEAFERELQQLWQQYANSILSQVRELQDDGIAGILESVFFVKTTQTRNSTPTQEAYKYVVDFLKRQGSSTYGRKNSRSFDRFKERYEDDAPLQRVVSDIEKLEQGLRRLEEPRNRLQELVNEFFFGSKKLSFADRGIQARVNDKELEIANFSSGEKQILRILVETIRCGPNTIVIDEPELSMHIDWQRRLLATMRTVNPEAQIIVATHSPEIMAEVADDNIFGI
ncbi:AAA family ATPase [Micromonospora saelicesensis]|uniref:AAA family ATPase n=1 Tax=Micromonospora saelicesensis TaxID=285676 RepID=UPI0015EB8F1A|nr:ATP-binding protein [Micromonospora saelicesensis]